VSNQTPLIPASKSIPEITFKALILSVILTALLAAANAFLGLKVGVTVSASIPAAVISLGVLRFFRNHNVLESTMVQTAASVGEGLTAGLAFIMPALLVLGYWQNFHYWQTVAIGLSGGLLGVLFSIPIRRALINRKELRFPEGVAIGNVLKASVSEESADLKMLVVGGIVGAIITLCQTGFRIVSDSVEYFWRVKGTLYGFGLGYSPALIAAGYIVGMNVGISMFVGVIIGWLIGVPVLTHVYGMPDAASAVDAANMLWSEHIRYMGVGAMLVGGLWTLVCLAKPVATSLKTSFQSIRDAKAGIAAKLPRTEKDIPMTTVLWLIAAIAIPTLIFVYMMINPSLLPISHGLRLIISLVTILYIIFVGFAFSSIAAYFAGLIGSTNSPGSGLSVCVLLFFSLITLALFSIDLSFVGEVSHVQLAAAGFAVMVIAILGAAMIIANETIQDLKVGQIVGATPWKQQVMLIIGVVVSALIIPPVLELLFQAYGMAGVFPRAGMDAGQMLAAPQAGLMAAVAKGAFGHSLPWDMISTGAVIAVFCIFADEFLKPRNMRLPVLAVGIGIYLPIDATIPVLFGGIIHYFVHRRFNKMRHQKHGSDAVDAQIKKGKHRGLTLACGFVAGSSLLGVVLAIPFAIAQNSSVLCLVGENFTPIANILGLIVTVVMCVWMYKKIVRPS
jgi:putative OPT family oligopeptide transporter